eukprot:TRINITY_DN5831_c0_g1_i14.p2 TRINITY_DN5831_c0_g1~~TRINITY_DN5831_c0_g1_i14.p2  ORF type:complete len:122 (+),score=30.63 TRINITY_DN5831_c0_g1_i14:65-430(+)
MCIRDRYMGKKRKKREKKGKDEDKVDLSKFQGYQGLDQAVIPNKDMKLISERKREIEFYCDRMNSILKNIEKADDDTEAKGSEKINPLDFSQANKKSEEEQHSYKTYSVDPYTNNQPLFTK